MGGTWECARGEGAGMCGSQTLPGLVWIYLSGRVGGAQNGINHSPWLGTPILLCRNDPLFTLTHLLFIIMRNELKNKTPVNLKLTLALTYLQQYASLLPVALPLSYLGTAKVNLVFYHYFGWVCTCVLYILKRVLYCMLFSIS